MCKTWKTRKYEMALPGAEGLSSRNITSLCIGFANNIENIL